MNTSLNNFSNLNTVNKVEKMMAHYENLNAYPKPAQEVRIEIEMAGPSERFEDALSVAISAEARKLSQAHKINVARINFPKPQNAIVDYSIQMTRAINMVI